MAIVFLKFELSFSAHLFLHAALKIYDLQQRWERETPLLGVTG